MKNYKIVLKMGAEFKINSKFKKYDAEEVLSKIEKCLKEFSKEEGFKKISKKALKNIKSKEYSIVKLKP